jgi:hypothetical protein
LHQFQLRVLTEFLRLLEEEVTIVFMFEQPFYLFAMIRFSAKVRTRARFSDACIDEYAIRDWGDAKSQVNCYQVVLYCVEDDTPANDFVSDLFL